MATTTTSGGRNSWVKPNGCRRPPNRPSIKTECVFSLFFSIRKENNGAQKIEYLYLLCAVAPAWGVNNPFRFSFTVSQSIAMHFGVCFCFFRRGFLAILFFLHVQFSEIANSLEPNVFFFWIRSPNSFLRLFFFLALHKSSKFAVARARSFDYIYFSIRRSIINLLRLTRLCCVHNLFLPVVVCVPFEFSNVISVFSIFVCFFF